MSRRLSYRSNSIRGRVVPKEQEGHGLETISEKNRNDTNSSKILKNSTRKSDPNAYLPTQNTENDDPKPRRLRGLDRKFRVSEIFHTPEDLTNANQNHNEKDSLISKYKDCPYHVLDLDLDLSLTREEIHIQYTELKQAQKSILGEKGLRKIERAYNILMDEKKRTIYDGLGEEGLDLAKKIGIENTFLLSQINTEGLCQIKNGFWEGLNYCIYLMTCCYFGSYCGCHCCCLFCCNFCENFDSSGTCCCCCGKCSDETQETEGSEEAQSLISQASSGSQNNAVLEQPRTGNLQQIKPAMLRTLNQLPEEDSKED